jgi:hypothetical protein
MEKAMESMPLQRRKIWAGKRRAEADVNNPIGIQIQNKEIAWISEGN